MHRGVYYEVPTCIRVGLAQTTLLKNPSQEGFFSGIKKRPNLHKVSGSFVPANLAGPSKAARPPA